MGSVQTYKDEVMRRFFQVRGFAWLAVPAAAVFFSGCGDDDRKVVVVQPERQVVVERGEPERVVVVDDDDDREVVVIREAPPTVVVERPPPRPSGSVIWVDGYWRHDGRRHVWVNGRYERVVVGARHVPARWVKTSRGYAFHRERWVRSRR